MRPRQAQSGLRSGQPAGARDGDIAGLGRSGAAGSGCRAETGCAGKPGRGRARQAPRLAQGV